MNNTQDFLANTIVIGSITMGGRHIGESAQVMAVSRSTDNGITWDCDDLSSTYGNVYTVLVDPNDSNIIYAGGSYVGTQDYYVTGLFKTTNGGTDWNEMSSSISGTIYTMCVDPFNDQKIFLGSTEGIYMSTDGGATWPVLNSFYSVRAFAVDPNTQNKIFAGTTSGVYVSTDGGTSWSSMNNGLGYGYVSCMDFDPVNDVLYVGTEGCGVFRYSLGTGVEDETIDIDVPTGFTLYQNYPNPFNTSTGIRYELFQNGNVQLFVYDLTGRIVKRLVDKFETAGIKTVNWNGTNDSGNEVSSGIYIMRLQCQNQVKTRKMILNK